MKINKNNLIYSVEMSLEGLTGWVSKEHDANTLETNGL